MSETPSSSTTPAAPAAPAAGGPAVTRRGLIVTGWAAFLGFLGIGGLATARFMFPNVLYEPSQRFKMGQAKELPMGVTINKQDRVWVVREEKGIYAFWSRCTHLGCTPNWFAAEGRFKCPCHGSNFNLSGDVIAGPAPKPLWRVAVSIAPSGDLVLDKSVMENRPGFRDKAPFYVNV